MRNSIIESINKDKFYINLCKKYCGNKDIAKDLWQHILLQLLELPLEKLQAIYNGNPKYYISKMIWFNWTSKTAPFWKTYKDNFKDDGIVPDVVDTENEYLILKEEVLKITDEVIQMEIEKQDKKGNYHWNVALFRLYFDSDDSMHDISKRSGVPYPTIRYNIEKIIDSINERINNNTARYNRD